MPSSDAVQRFQRFETLLRACTGDPVADLIRTLAAARRWGDAAPSLGAILIDDVLDLDALAHATGRSSKTAREWVFDSSQTARADLGFGLVASPGRPPAGRAVRGAVADLTPAFLDVLDARATQRFAGGTLPVVSDTATRDGIALIARAAANGAATTMLYRVGPAAPLLEVERLACDLQRDPELLDVLVGGLGEIGGASPIASALCAALHGDPHTLLIIGHDLRAGGAATATETDEWDEPCAEAAKTSLPASLVHLLRIAPGVGMPIVLAVPADIRLDPGTLPMVSAAFGPYRLDRSHAIAAIMQRSPGAVLARDAAERVLRVVGDPTAADEILRTAAIITGLTAGQLDAVGAGEAQGDAGEPPRAPMKRGGTPDLELPAAAEAFSRCVAKLATSLLDVQEPTACAAPTIPAPFDPDLFVADPDPSFLFERAAMLYDEGARIALNGPSGVGKTALVAELGRRMGSIEVKQHSGATLFARAWGRAEKNIMAAVHGGAGALTFFDEADALMGLRDGGPDTNSSLTVTATTAFLTAMQDPRPRSPIIVATNRVENIDPALRRRFDVIVTVKPLPDEREILAWRRLLRLEPPREWRPIGGTVPGDYVKAARQLRFLGRVDAETAAACVRQARDDRGADIRENTFGFLADRSR